MISMSKLRTRIAALRLLTPALIVTAAWLATTEQTHAETFLGEAYIRTDAQERIVIVLDEAPVDGVADHAFLFDPSPALKDPIEPVRAEVAIDYTLGELVLRGIDEPLFFDLVVNQNPDPVGSEEYSGGLVILSAGKALRRHTNPEWTVSPEYVDTDRIITILPPDESPLVITCGKDGKVKSDTDCTKGGPGSSRVKLDCPGIPGMRGEKASTTCRSGSYACGYCKFGLAYAVCRSERCDI